MDVDTETATRNIFKRRCPTRAVCCPIHEKKICVKYIQPPRPEPFKPLHCYNGPISPLESDTIYHLSYRNVDAKDARPPAALPRGHINFPSEKIEDSTTMGLSYQWNSQAPPSPFMPRSFYEKPTGPLQELTTQRHDFPSKPTQRAGLILPRENIHAITAKMEDRSITMDSFLPIDKPEPLHSFKPIHKYEPPKEPLEKETITQISYMQPEMPPREIYPWMLRSGYKNPEPAIDDNTVYSGSYMAPGSFEKSSEEPNEDARAICYCRFPKADEDL